jgi:chromosome segregation ATPase
VNQVNSIPDQGFHTTDLRAEVIGLRQALAQRDQLIEQFSKALYAQICQPADPSANALVPAPKSAISELEQQELEQQLFFCQQQISNQNTEIANLRDAHQRLTDRNQMLEKVIQELPQVYRQKFAERLSQVKVKMEALQKENRQLHADLHQINYILSGRKQRNPDNLALPHGADERNPPERNTTDRNTTDRSTVEQRQPPPGMHPGTHL